MLIGWTTVPTRGKAEDLAAGAVAAGLACCVQVEGPLVSHYLWNGGPERSEEFRLCFKFAEDRAQALEAFVLSRHAYEVPEWVVVQASHVAEKYLSWASAPRTPSNL